MSITRDPALIWRPLKEAYSQPFITPTQVIVHTAVDAPGATNLHGYFNRGDIGLESHTWLSWNRHEQFMPFNRRADANYRANRRPDGTGAISIETEDDGNPVGRPWNTYQCFELIRFGAWCSDTYGIPPRLCRSSADPGFGYHSQFPGVWSNVAGKTCPGSTRIAQFKSIVIPGIVATLEGEDMSQYAEKLDAILAETTRAVEAALRVEAEQVQTNLRINEVRANVRTLMRKVGVSEADIRR